MRLYGKRIIRQQAQRRLAEGRELRDAIIMTIEPLLHYCLVKIQGTNQSIRAYYNQNWEATPQWLKRGNAVRITTPGGNIGRVEIAGHGFIIPTAVTGGSVTPVQPDPEDAVITGMELLAGGSGMTAKVTAGTYRISGDLYYLDAMEMDQTDVEMEVPTLELGDAISLEFDNVSAGQFRIDIVVIGIDGIVHIEKGTPSTGEPTAEDTPIDHVLIGWVLFNPSMADSTSAFYGIISQKDINGTWGASAPAALRLTGDFELDWSTETTQIRVRVVDQYGQVVAGTYFLTITDAYGNGSLSVTEFPHTFDGDTIITYTRYGEPPGEDVTAGSSLLTFQESSTSVTNIITILLFDDSEPPIEMWNIAS